MFTGLATLLIGALFLALILGVFAVILAIIQLSRKEKVKKQNINEGAQSVNRLLSENKISQAEADELKKAIGFMFIPEEQFKADKHIQLAGLFHLVFSIIICLPILAAIVFLFYTFHLKTQRRNLYEQDRLASRQVRHNEEAEMFQQKLNRDKEHLTKKVSAWEQAYKKQLQAIEDRRKAISSQKGDSNRFKQMTANLDNQLKSLNQDNQEKKEYFRKELKRLDNMLKKHHQENAAEMHELKVEREQQQRHEQAAVKKAQIGLIIGASIFLLSLGVFSMYGLAAFKLLKRSSWSRGLILFASIILVLFFPLGTALGIYSIWVLMMRDNAAEYFA